jgi:threonyl-tRNA synthetase
MKVPYTVVIGDKEINSGELSVRVRKDLAVSSEAHTLSIDELLNTIVNESKSRTSKTSI